MLQKAEADVPAATDPAEAAHQAGLRYVSDDKPGIARRRAGKGFSYRGPDGSLIKDTAELARIKALAVPPAWTDVWICPDPKGHLQATGRDAKGRKQYRYHPEFREVRDSAKYEHMHEFARALPAIRRKIGEHMKLRGLPREKVLATTIYLLETTLIRVGNEDYAKHNESYGLTTLQDEHVDIHGAELRFHFKGKSGKEWQLGMRDKRIAKIVKQCQDLPGQDLLQYVGEDGERHHISSSDVNTYLKEISGRDITAKDFRTWAGTVLAALALQEFEAVDSAAKKKKNVRAAIEKVAARLGNTPTICRKCYVHPDILDCYVSGSLLLEIKDEIASGLEQRLEGLRPEEAAVLALLGRRVGEEIEERSGGGKRGKKAKAGRNGSSTGRRAKSGDAAPAHA